jgi:hypothetical protein
MLEKARGYGILNFTAGLNRRAEPLPEVAKLFLRIASVIGREMLGEGAHHSMMVELCGIAVPLPLDAKLWVKCDKELKCSIWR